MKIARYLNLHTNNTSNSLHLRNEHYEGIDILKPSPFKTEAFKTKNLQQLKDAKSLFALENINLALVIQNSFL